MTKEQATELMNWLKEQGYILLTMKEVNNE